MGACRLIVHVSARVFARYARRVYDLIPPPPSLSPLLLLCRYDSEEDPEVIVGAWISVRWPEGRFVCQVTGFDAKRHKHSCVYATDGVARWHIIGGAKCDDWFECTEPPSRSRKGGGGGDGGEQYGAPPLSAGGRVFSRLSSMFGF